MLSASVALSKRNPLRVAGGSGLRGRSLPAARPCGEILDLVRKIAGTDVPVLIQGEIGAGKQTIAREIHRRSPRAARPLVHVVCGSLRESDLEEKLFGPSWDCSRRRHGRAGEPLGVESARHVIS